MAWIRRVRTASGATAVQIAEYDGGRHRIVAHVGSARAEADLGILLERARGPRRVSFREPKRLNQTKIGYTAPRLFNVSILTAVPGGSQISRIYALRLAMPRRSVIYGPPSEFPHRGTPHRHLAEASPSQTGWKYGQH